MESPALNVNFLNPKPHPLATNFDQALKSGVRDWAGLPDMRLAGASGPVSLFSFQCIEVAQKTRGSGCADEQRLPPLRHVEAHPGGFGRAQAQRIEPPLRLRRRLSHPVGIQKFEGSERPPTSSAGHPKRKQTKKGDSLRDRNSW